MNDDTEQPMSVDARESDKRSSSRIAYQICQHIIDGEDLKAFTIVDSLRSEVQQRSGDGWACLEEFKQCLEVDLGLLRNEEYRMDRANRELLKVELTRLQNRLLMIEEKARRQSNTDERMDS